MKVKLTLTDEMLGTKAADPEIHEKFITSKSADAEKAQEEQEALPAEELIEKGRTIFSRDEDDNPIMWDYQIRGFIKENLGAILMLGEEKEIKIGKRVLLSHFKCKGYVDNHVFVTPRVIQIGLSGPVDSCTRTLRSTPPRGAPITALITSESVPAGSTLEFEIEVEGPDRCEALVRMCFDRGSKKGLGQWRNSGKGRFTWEEVE